MKKIILILSITLYTGLLTSTKANTYEYSNLVNVCYKANQIDAEFVGKSKKSLYFKQLKDGKMLEFTIINMSILSKYDFDDKKNIGKIFNLTYEVQKLETILADTENKGAKISQFVERRILMNLERKEGIVTN